MDVQWKPPQSGVAGPKKRVTRAIGEEEMKQYKPTILKLIEQGAYQSTINALRDEHQFEISMDQLKKHLKIWRVQKKPRRNVPTPGGAIVPDKKTALIFRSKNPFASTSAASPYTPGQFSSLAIASFPSSMGTLSDQMGEVAQASSLHGWDGPPAPHALLLGNQTNRDQIPPSFDDALMISSLRLRSSRPMAPM
ncbi:hypothetical protein TWF481_007693 [Arthrobotrys musiformis]|uniref:Clr5 domain-containing protein n=1 Tax=Arthrobotrys musiformis TaxID=47236 RepID=A0AAV9WHZ2_9PEZI